MKAQMIQKADVIYPFSSLFLQPHYLSLSLSPTVSLCNTLTLQLF